jgi:NDP-sugar pyrophosphorylase family protein
VSEIELIVLAGGFGTRIRAAVGDVPKPLAPVAGRPFLQLLIENWMAQGVRNFTFLLHYQADVVSDFIDAQKKMASMKHCKLRVLTEQQPLGTGGAIFHAVRELNLRGSFLVANSDTWLGAGIQQVHDVGSPSMAVVNVKDTSRYGRVCLEKDSVSEFHEKKSSIGAGTINAGLYHLHAEIFRECNSQPFSLEDELFPMLVAEGKMRAVMVDEDFIDIGIPDDYFRFCSWIESGKVRDL